MRKLVVLTLMFLSFSGLACSRGTEQRWAITGHYPGEVTLKGGKVHVTVPKVKVSALDSYQKSKPKTTGKALVIFFENDSLGMGTNYALYVYRDEWTLRKLAALGISNTEVATGKTASLGLGSGVRIQFERRVMETTFKNCRSEMQ